MDKQDMRDDIDALFASLAQQHREAETPYSTTGAIAASPQPHIIDVYIVDHSDEEEPHPIIESTLNTLMEQDTHEQQESHTSQENDAYALPPSSLAPRTPCRPRWWVVVGVAFALLGIGIALCYSVLFIQTPSATVTLVLQAHTLTSTTTLHVVPDGHTDPTTKTLAGRMLPTLTMSQQQSVPTTGMVHQAAQAARGVVTFYNAAPYTQTIAAGTLLTGINGVSIVTEQDALIPAAVMPTEGQVMVAAHAALTGPEGNIGAGAIYGVCCRLNVFVANGAFTGGQDARIYQTVTAQDVQGVVTHITSSLLQSVQAALQTQVHPTETLLTPPTCTQQVTASPAVGMQAATVSVTVNETCTGMTYATQDETMLATQNAMHEASTQFGTGYTTTNVQTSITQVTPEAHGITDLRVTSRSLWTAQMSETQQQAIKAMIAGKGKEQATGLLLHLLGVQSVSLTLTHGTTLPKETAHIALLLIEPQE